MVAVVQQIHAARALPEQEREERGIGFRGIARDAGEDQVVGPVVRGLAATGTDVVQGDDIG